MGIYQHFVYTPRLPTTLNKLDVCIANTLERITKSMFDHVWHEMYYHLLIFNNKAWKVFDLLYFFFQSILPDIVHKEVIFISNQKNNFESPDINKNVQFSLFSLEYYM